jgi:ABC-type multidrug transport system fused ATPase/permease subunit
LIVGRSNQSAQRHFASRNKSAMKINPVDFIVKRPLSSWIFAGNLKLQLMVLILVAFTVFSRVLPLEMQKRIINEAIKLRNIDLLLIYCGIYLAAVVSANGLKFIINYLETLISQRSLAKMRKDLYSHVLTLPINFFRNTQAGMVVSAIVNELSTAGNFVGMAISVPVINVLTLVAFAAYLIWLNWFLGLVSLAIYPIALFLLPFLQRRVNQANKKRVDITRNVSSLIGEIITGIHEVHGNGSYRIEQNKFDKLITKLENIRVIWTLYRNALKVASNFFSSIGPFLVFILGGYLTMLGQLELGALVAFLSAQEKLYDPWKELIEFYQVYQDASVSYKRTMSYFESYPEHSLIPEGREVYNIDPSLEIKDLGFLTESGIPLLEKVSLRLKPGEHLAIIGFSGSGKSTLALCIAQLYKYSSGSLLFGGYEVSDLTKKDIVHNMGFVSQAPFIFSGTIEENLLYSCKAMKDDPSDKSGLPTRDDMIEVLQQTGLFIDVLRFGLNTVLDRSAHQELVVKIIRVREKFQKNFGETLIDHVEFYNKNNYLFYSSVSENLIFGAPNESSLQDLCQSPYFMNFLSESDLTRPLISLGIDLATQTVDILGKMPPEAMFFEQSPILPEEIDDFRVLVERLKHINLHQLETQDRQRLLELALRFTPGKHKMAALPGFLDRLILEGRALLNDKLAADMPGKVTLYDKSNYIYSQSMLNNILFGRAKSSHTQSVEKINQSIIHLLIDEELLEDVLEIGMAFSVGSKGDNLSGGQRQKLAIARSLLKSPGLLVMDEATSALDNKSQSRIQMLLNHRFKNRTTVVAVVHRLDIVKNYDRIAVMKAGKIIEMGTYDELINKKGALYELVTGKK